MSLYLVEIHSGIAEKSRLIRSTDSPSDSSSQTKLLEKHEFERFKVDIRKDNKF